MSIPAFAFQDSSEPVPDFSPVIAGRRVAKSFGGRAILRDIELAVGRGEILAIVGESGCGKSTLLRLFAGLEDPDSGEIAVNGEISVVFQDARLLPWMRVWENVAFGLKLSRSEKRDLALDVLNEVGLAPLGHTWPTTLSGGEAQRVALARAIIRNPSVLLLDEPFGALDALTRLRMHRLLLNLWQRHGFTVVLVTHDVDEALSLADRIAVLGEGRVLDQLSIPLARPRDRLDLNFGVLRNRLLGELGVPVS